MWTVSIGLLSRGVTRKKLLRQPAASTSQNEVHENSSTSVSLSETQYAPERLFALVINPYGSLYCTFFAVPGGLELATVKKSIIVERPQPLSVSASLNGRIVGTWDL